MDPRVESKWTQEERRKSSQEEVRGALTRREERRMVVNDEANERTEFLQLSCLMRDHIFFFLLGVNGLKVYASMILRTSKSSLKRR